MYFLIDPGCPVGPRGYLFYVAFCTWRCAIMNNDGTPVSGFSKSGQGKTMDWPSPTDWVRNNCTGDWWEFGGTPWSYGMNRCAHRFLGGSDKILAVEYCKLVADLPDMTSADLNRVTDTMKNSPVWTGWGGGRARHVRTMAVLFEDGRVETRNPDAIDPRIVDLNQRLWQPALPHQ
jgi:hypothetical protein